MNSEQEGTVDDELDNNELLADLQQDSELTRLTEIVRKHYLNYLEKQLQENLNNSNFNKKKNGVKANCEDVYKESIQKTAELLEDKAVKACMVAQYYQRAMVKIISIVRRSTEEQIIISQLERLILTQDESKLKIATKETQTEAGLLTFIEYDIEKPPMSPNDIDDTQDKDKPTMTLDEKIEMFQKHLQKEKCAEVIKKCPINRTKDYKKSRRNQKSKSHHKHHRPYIEQSNKNSNLSPAASVITPTVSPHTSKHRSVPVEQHIKQETLRNDLNQEVESREEDNDVNDSVALELARLFSEEKTELDEIFGIDPNDEPDDPQICKILKEIEEATINYVDDEKPLDVKTSNNTLVETNENPHEKSLSNSSEIKKTHQHCVKTTPKSIDLSKSIWPCELFMQRRKLSETLARLIEEDLRWHDIMKWKFFELFGEDSDDEFTPCSPSIELNEILIGSCIKRISPWIVKHLMKPMKDGLIGNRFLFKKLAKHLARTIIMENQYPDESTIKNCIENFFCLHQVVVSMDDLVDMPSISLF